MAELQPPPLVLCMENVSGEEVSLKIESEDDFQSFLDRAKSILGYDVDINSITSNQPVSPNDNIYQFFINSKQNFQNNPILDESLEHNGSNDLVYILHDGTQIRASQIHFDNEDPLVDLTAEKIPFVQFTNDINDFVIENIVFEKTVNYNIVESPVSRWSSQNSSPKSFVNSLPFKLVCNNTSRFEAQFTNYLESSTKTYATLNNVTNNNKSPRSLIRDNYTKYDDNYQHKSDNLTREEILNMFKDSPVTSLPFEGCTERKHIRKTDPSRVHKNSKPTSYEIDGVLISENGIQMCFICGEKVDNNADKLYLFDNEDQKIHKCSPQKKMDTQLKIICENCLNDNFKPCRMKGANQFLNSDEFLVIRNNQQYIFQKIKKIKFKSTFSKESNSKITDEFVKVEIGSDGEIITKPIDEMPDDVIIVNDEGKEGRSSDVEIIEPEPEIDKIIDNLEEADEEVKDFLGKYQCEGEIKELKCRFCDTIFTKLSEVTEHAEMHKHDLEDGQVFPCPLCNYGYADFKWLKAHLKAAHEPKEKEHPDKQSQDDNKLPLTCESFEPPEIKTEVKQECLNSSDDEIWIVQTADVDATQELQTLLNAAKVVETDQEKRYKKPPKCLNCSQTFPSVESLASHKCTRRGRKRKSFAKDNNSICIPTQEDFMKRARGRPRQVAMTDHNDLLLMIPRKNKTKEMSDPRIVTCHNCNESFTSKVRLKFHMQFHETTSLLNSDGQYTCVECDSATFETETALFDHLHFQHDKQKRWQCPVRGCGKTFHLRATLTKHSRTHTDTRRYVCVTCGKRFLDKQTLDEHGVTHLQIKPFQCHICLKQLTRRSRLRMHVRAHEAGLAPRLVRACCVCGRAFKDAHHAHEHAVKSTECVEAFTNELKKEDEEVAVQLSPTSGIVRHSVHIVESPKLSKPIPRQVASPVAEPLLAQVADEARTVIRVVEIEKAFRCEYCEDVFYLEDNLNAHRAIHKGVKNPFTCHICKVSFATYSRCTTHKTTHGFYKRSLSDAKKQPAEQAAAEPGTAAGILGYGDFPVVKHFLCEDCGRSYLHWTYLQVHRRMKHANENYTYTCNQCDLTFPNSWSVAYHRKKVHGKNGSDGPSVTVTKEARDNYRIPCRDCDEVLPNKTALYKHRKKEHSDLSLRINNRQGAFCCGACGKQYGSRGGLEAHARAPCDVTSAAACAKCATTFAHAADLHRHLKDVHGHELDFSCSLCSKAFCSRGELSAHARTHARTHAAPRPHACAVCGHAFRTLSMINEHLRIHTGERPFPCDVCGVAFRRSTAMRNHRLIHTGERAWRCARCPKRFRVRSDLRTHLRLKHPAHLALIEVEGLNPSPDEVMKSLSMNGISHEKVIEITKISFSKGTSSVVPSSTRALSMLSHVPRARVACGNPAPEPVVEEFQPARRGRGIAKNPRRPKILQRGGAGPAPRAALSVNELSELNQLLLRDGVLVNGNQMVQLQLDDTMLL